MMSRQKGLISYLKNEQFDVSKEEMFINITLYDVPASLVREFAVKFAYKYPGGISEAIQDLMGKAIKE